MDKILVVDDDLDILTMVKISLTINGYEAQAISRWQDIDDSIVKMKPDLVLLDVSLGGADGREICKKLKLQEATHDIPVILFSANVEMEKSVSDCNAQAFIAKPYDLSYFLQTIRTTINNSKQDTA